MYLLGLMSTKISNYVFKILNPTINLQVGDFNNFPVLSTDSKPIINIVEKSIDISKQDWNSFETSWDFKKHPLLTHKKEADAIEGAFKNWSIFAEKQFNQLKANEEELNRIFIEIYGLQGELTPDVDDKDVTITRIYDSKEAVSYTHLDVYKRQDITHKAYEIGITKDNLLEIETFDGGFRVKGRENGKIFKKYELKQRDKLIHLSLIHI